MTVYYSQELAGIASLPVVKVNSSAYGATMRRFRAVVALAAQATTDTIYVAFLSAGEDFMCGFVNTTVSLGTATIALGVTGTTGKYRAAAVQTAVDTPSWFGTAAQGAAAPLAAEDQVFATIAAAALPGSGTFVVEHICSRP